MGRSAEPSHSIVKDRRSQRKNRLQGCAGRPTRREFSDSPICLGRSMPKVSTQMSRLFAVDTGE
jgi:hypothetical protein